MGTNLHKIKFPMIARSLRAKSMCDLRRIRRFQVFVGHRFQHFLTTDEQAYKCFQVIQQHLSNINGYSIEEKFATVLLILIKETPHIFDVIQIEWPSELLEHINNKLNALVSSIRCILNGININYLVENQIGLHFECDRLTVRPNINKITNLMTELLAQLQQTLANQCTTLKLPLTKEHLYTFELCYERYGHLKDVITQNLHTLNDLTQGFGRFERTTEIVSYEPLMQRLLTQHTNEQSELLVVLQIMKSITNGFPENTRFLHKYNLLGFLKNQLTHSKPHGAACTEEIFSILETICGNLRSDIQAVIEADLIAPLIDVFKSTSNINYNLRKLALNAFYGISTLGSIDQLKVLLNHDLLQLLCGQLKYENNSVPDHILEVAFQVMKNILDDFNRRDHYTFHRISSVIIVCGGYTAIMQLIDHENTRIAYMAYELSICSKCRKCNEMA